MNEQKIVWCLERQSVAQVYQPPRSIIKGRRFYTPPANVIDESTILRRALLKVN